MLSNSLLTHYASKLPSDRFTNVNVYWRRVDLEDGVCAALELPSTSTIKKEIIGEAQVNIRLAKQHAAFLACKQLYENGELNDNLVPIDDKQKIEMHNDEYFPHWEAYSNDKKEAGNRTHRRYHQMKTPAVLMNCAPKVGSMSYLYHIKVQPKFDTSTKYLKEFSKLLRNQKDFGILMSKRFPRMCVMSLFQTFGEIQVEVHGIPYPVTLKDDAELDVLKNFHVAIFKDVLNTWQDFFVLDDSSYLIVPLMEDIQIDWNIANEFQSVEQPRRLTYDEIIRTEFTRRAYIHRVINPVYKDSKQKYVVIDVPEHLTPESPFPDNKFSSYKEYYKDRLEATIVKGNQPLIEVKGVSSSCSMFFPGTGLSGKQRRYEKEQLPEHLVPELCHNYKFPAGYWLKATLLPSICHRIEYMLLAEELRMWLVDEKIDLSFNRKPLPLDVDYGNYDEREKLIDEKESQRETYGRFNNFTEIKQQIDQEQASTSAGEVSHRSSSLMLWNKSQLPIDIDRNWLTITEVDLIYYCNFLNGNQNQITPASLNRLQQLNGSSATPSRYLMDAVDRQDIKILKLTPKGRSVQLKDLMKALTTSNAGKICFNYLYVDKCQS